MTALEKLTLSRLEDRVGMLEATVDHVVGRLELVEQACCAVSDACATLLIRVDTVEMQLCDLKSHSRNDGGCHAQGLGHMFRGSDVCEFCGARKHTDVTG